MCVHNSNQYMATAALNSVLHQPTFLCAKLSRVVACSLHNLVIDVDSWKQCKITTALSLYQSVWTN
jgi:3-deoxy-D-manno-octulosonic acid (KDO) 8-phosphate synthase